MLRAPGGETLETDHDWLHGFAKPLLQARLEATAPPPGKYVAFAGLARPEKFFDTLTALGVDLEDMAPYPDHHPYREDNLVFLTRLADERGAKLITTEKDAARLAPGLARAGCGSAGDGAFRG